MNDKASVTNSKKQTKPGVNNNSDLQDQRKLLLDLALSLHHATDVGQILSTLAQEVSKHFKADYVRLFAYNAVDNEVYSRVKPAGAFEDLRFDVSDSSLAGYTALHRKVVAVDDVRNLEPVAERYPGLVYDARFEDHTCVKVRSIISAPLLNEDHLVGIIQLVNTGRAIDSYTTEDIDLLIHIGKLVAAAIFHHDERQKRATKFDLLLEDGVISSEELTQALRSARANKDDHLKGDPATVLLENYGVSHDVMEASLSRFYLTDFLPYDKYRIIAPELTRGVNAAYLRSGLVLPIELKDGTLTLWMADPYDSALITELKKSFGALRCKLFVGFASDIVKTIDHAFGMEDEEAEQLNTEMHSDTSGMPFDTDLEVITEEAPLVVRTVNKLILDAFRTGASDIHIEPGLGKSDTLVRFRRDGVCHTHIDIPASVTPAVINRAKLMAGLKIEEHRFPQSGKIKLKHGGDTIELRVETTPTVGRKEDVVMRLLAGGRFMRIDDLNMSEIDQRKLLDMIAKPYGIILAVGPTGSGKTTTLHAILHHLNSGKKKIWTVEDPVEITQPGLRQVQVNFNIKPKPFDFALAMRSFLRADPDIIMVGEMRDEETADIAVEASLTGHLVLSTLHTNSAPETVTRLTEMGIDPFNVADSLLGVLAQRLVRVLCEDCKQAHKPDASEQKMLGETEVEQLYQPSGCTKCDNTGYKGRTGIYELLVATDTLKELITKHSSIAALREQAYKDGMTTMRMDGIRLVKEGRTTLAEVSRVCIY